MSQSSAVSARVTVLGCILAALFPFALAQSDVVDITPDFIRGGAVIEDLRVIRISDVVLIRGKTNDPKKAAAVSRIAETLGHLRVANLIVVRNDVTDDAAIVYTGQRQLELERQLDGCRFTVYSNLGVVRLTGSVHRIEQRDLAVAILARMDGVKAVHPDVTIR